MKEKKKTATNSCFKTLNQPINSHFASIIIAPIDALQANTLYTMLTMFYKLIGNIKASEKVLK